MKRIYVAVIILTLLAVGCYNNYRPHPEAYTIGGMFFPVDTVGGFEFRVRLYSAKIPQGDSGNTKSEFTGTLDIARLSDSSATFGNDSELLVRIDSLLVAFEDPAKKEYARPIVWLSLDRQENDGAVRKPVPIYFPPFAYSRDKTELLLQYNVLITAIDEKTILATKLVEHRLYCNSDDSSHYRWTTDQNSYPNPFSPTTTISYDIPESSSVLVVIYSVLGTVVDTLVNETQAAGHYNITWNADSTITSGIYFYKIIAGEYTATKKMVLLR